MMSRFSGCGLGQGSRVMWVVTRFSVIWMGLVWCGLGIRLACDVGGDKF